MFSIIKRKRSTLGLVLLCASLLIGSNSFAAAETSFSQNGKFTVGGNVKKVDMEQVQSFTGIEANVRIPYQLESVEYYEVQGVKKDDGTYSYHYEMTIPPEQRDPVIAAPVEYNEKEHRLLIKVGAAPKGTKAMVYPGEDEGTRVTSPAPTPTALGDGVNTETNAIALASTDSGKFRTIWEDPVKLNVNWVRDNLSYSYNGSTVSWISGDDERWWLSGTGWWEQDHSINSYYGSGNTSVTVSTDSHFMNQTFCVANPTTEVFYNGNKITGHKDGSITVGVDTNATGGCSSWLSHYSEFTR